MDSNSPAPFLGFELSVDASDAQRSADSKKETEAIRTVSIVASEFENERPIQASLTKNAANDHVDGHAGDPVDDRFVTTSETRARNGNLKYSLPTVNLDDGGVDAAQVDEIISRFPGS